LAGSEDFIKSGQFLENCNNIICRFEKKNISSLGSGLIPKIKPYLRQILVNSIPCMSKTGGAKNPTLTSGTSPYSKYMGVPLGDTPIIGDPHTCTCMYIVDIPQ